MPLNNLSSWDTSGQLSPYKSSAGSQAIGGIGMLMQILQQQQQDKALRQAAGQMMGGNAVPAGVDAGKLYSDLAVNKYKPVQPNETETLLNYISGKQGGTSGLLSNATEPAVPEPAAVEQPVASSDMLMRGIMSKKFGVPYEQLMTPEEKAEKNKQEIQQAVEKQSALESLKPPTQEQETSNVFANRMEQADRVLDRIGGVGLGNMVMRRLPNPLKTNEAQEFEQAKRNFLNAVLRRESGAVINPSEFKEGELQYFAQPGDKPGVLKEKDINRETVKTGMVQSAGKAYKKMETGTESPHQEPQGSLKEVLPPALAAGGVASAGASLLGIGAAKVIPKAANIAKNTPNVWSTKRQAGFAEEVQKTFVQQHSNQVKKFGSKLATLAQQNPEASINLSEFITEILDPESGVSPQAMSIFKKTPKLLDMIKNPKLAETVSLRDAQDIINHLNVKIPKQIRATNLDVIEAVNTVKGAQLQAFPQMAKVRESYAKFMQPYKNIKRYFGFNKTIPAIEGDVPFGGAQGWEAAQKVLPKETLKNIKGFRGASRFKELVTKPVKGIGRAAGVGKLLGVAPSLLQAIDMAQKWKKAKETGWARIGVGGEIIPVSPDDLAL